MPRKLKDVTSRIFQGLKTSADKIYIVERRAIEQGNVRVFCRQNEREYLLESALLHPLVKGGDSKAYRLTTTDRLILFPYAPAAKEKSALIAEGYLQSKYPLTMAYLEDHREFLKNREQGKMNHAGWYGFVYPKALDVMPLPKIFTPDIAPRAAYSFDPTGECFFTGGAAGGYGILPQQGESTAFLLGLLNSAVLDWFLQHTATPMRGGWFSYEARYIRDMPIPDSSPTQRAVVECLVDYLLWLNREQAGHDRREESRMTLLTGYFEQWVNALVYELFFAEELHQAGLNFFRLAEEAKLRRLSEMEGNELSTIERLFEEVYRPEHALRQGLFALDSIDEIRLIEGKA